MAADAIVDTVADMAARLGYLVHHDRPARTAKGWRTAILGHAGFPDILAVHPELGTIAAECKGDKNGLTPDQRRWRAALEAVGIRYYVWRPADWRDGTIERALRGQH